MPHALPGLAHAENLFPRRCEQRLEPFDLLVGPAYEGEGTNCNTCVIAAFTVITGVTKGNPRSPLGGSREPMTVEFAFG